MQHPGGAAAMNGREDPLPLPLVVTLNCLEDDDLSLERDLLAGAADIQRVSLGRLADGRIESAAAVLLHSLALLPRAAQRRLQPWQLLLCIGSPDKVADSTTADELGLSRLLVHVDVRRHEEITETVMALVLGLLRRTHPLARSGGGGGGGGAAAASGWLMGAVRPLCRGMRRCRGMVLGIIGRNAAACCLAERSLAFKMSVLYFDFNFQEVKGKQLRPSLRFPSAARRMDTLNDLMAASDLISLHLALTNETIHIVGAECLQHVKPGAYIVNTGSSQLIDDCALKQLLLDGTISGCALDGAEGPHWMEAWIREMPNVLILPRSADYSEEVWLELREKAVSILQTFFFEGIIPKDAISDEEDETEFMYDNVINETHAKERALLECNSSSLADERAENHDTFQKQDIEIEDPHSHYQGEESSPVTGARSDGRQGRSGKKGKKRSARRRSEQKHAEPSILEKDDNFTLQLENDGTVTGKELAQSSSSYLASPEDSLVGNTQHSESVSDLTYENHAVIPLGLSRPIGLPLKEGYVIALHARDRPGFHVSRQRVHGGGWFLDTMPNVTKRDPAAQFLVVFKSKDAMGLRSFAAGGKLLQINRKLEFVFASHSFDVWESWSLEGASLDECCVINCRNPSAILNVRIEIVAAVGEEDGVLRWLD